LSYCSFRFSNLVLHNRLGFALHGNVKFAFGFVFDLRLGLDVGASILLGATTLLGRALEVLIVSGVLALAWSGLWRVGISGLLLWRAVEVIGLDRIELGL
jgi:hypothetical protein